LRQAGRVIDVTPPGAAQIVGVDHSTRTAHYMDPIDPGDLIRFVSSGELTANLYGKEVTFKSGEPISPVPTHDPGFFSLLDIRYFEQFSHFLAVPRMSMGIATLPRRDLEHPAAPVFSFNPALSRTEQYFPRGATASVVLWAGPASPLIVTPDRGGPIRLSPAGAGWGIVPLSSSSARLEVALSDAPLGWTLTVADLPPSPPWFTSPVAQLSEAERLVRALWILRDGPTSWRLYAATELHDLASARNFVATQFWQGLRSGELSALLTPARGPTK
jgi:hypothetical protein